MHPDVVLSNVSLLADQFFDLVQDTVREVYKFKSDDSCPHSVLYQQNSGVRVALDLSAEAFQLRGLVVAGIILMVSPACTWADPAATLIAALVILCFTVKLLYVYVKRGFLVFPEHIDTAKVLNVLKQNDHVMNCRHLNIWKNSADELEVSAHLSLDDMTAVEMVKKEAKHSLRHMGFEIVTLAFKKHKEE